MTDYQDNYEKEAATAITRLTKKETVIITRWPVAELVAAWILENDTEKEYALDRRGNVWVFGLKKVLYPMPLQWVPPTLSIEERYRPALELLLREGSVFLGSEYSVLDFFIVAYPALERRGVDTKRLRGDKQASGTLVYLVNQ